MCLCVFSLVEKVTASQLNPIYRRTAVLLKARNRFWVLWNWGGVAVPFCSWEFLSVYNNLTEACANKNTRWEIISVMWMRTVELAGAHIISFNNNNEITPLLINHYIQTVIQSLSN